MIRAIIKFRRQVNGVSKTKFRLVTLFGAIPLVAVVGPATFVGEFVQDAWKNVRYEWVSFSTEWVYLLKEVWAQFKRGSM